ncbi:MAG: NAD(P)/FAD-dependent oxidoreductase [Burkholderiales bacterium]|jgi:cation diffusion facilitator CzcD-associated flavoprotein CzcO|nr:NAD(P)/FAD-dependent oxidoreductase [Burkholderiales bacterium]
MDVIDKKSRAKSGLSIAKGRSAKKLAQQVISKAQTSGSPSGVFDTLIIGSGFAGLGCAIKLKESGIENFIILERKEEVGGTWRDNQYPGAACDIPSNLYSFSFAQNPEWSRSYSGSKEILAYVHQMVEAFNLAAFIRFKQTVNEARWNEAAGHWEISCEEGGVYKARTVVMAGGPLSNAKLPNIKGIERFEGKKIHSAQWDHSYDMAGKRVAVVGTGASAVQIIPELVKTVGKLKVFQRTPGWVMPRPDFATPGWHKAVFRRLPFAQTAVREALFWLHESMATAVIWNSPLTKLGQRLSLAFLNAQVKDPWMRRQLKPDFNLGCKRVLVSNDYYPALQKPNCELITWPIATISEKGLRTADGVEHLVDCIVFATGFDVPKNSSPFKVTGRDGRDLGQEWAKGAKAYKSINVSGYPNLFITFGPNSGPGHNSALVFMEPQIDYVVRGVRKILTEGLKMLDVKPLAQESYNADIQKRLAKTNWNSGCKSWYLTEDGFNATMYPGFATQYASQMSTFEAKDYVTEPLRVR